MIEDFGEYIADQRYEDAAYEDLERRGDLVVMPKRCPECGSKEVFWDDDHEMVDCFGCGIWFDPQVPENKGCFDEPEAA